MILTPTLFVLGAGASKPYGLPLGSELRTLICNAEYGANSIVSAITKDGYYTQADVKNVTRTFLQSGVSSIDEFLSRHDHLTDVGKMLIAAIIRSKENPVEIFSEENSDHWYRLLWKKLIEGTTKGDELKQNNVRFITFNYDRSLEFFLHASTKATYGLNDSYAYSIWSSLLVNHVYGSVGKFDFQASRGGMPKYSEPINAEEIRAAAGDINIMPEGRNDASQFENARDWFKWAHNVYILGFGFDRLNCERLGFPAVLQHKIDIRMPLPLPYVVASVFGLTKVEVVKAKQHLLGNMVDWNTHNENNTMTLRHTGLPD